MRHTAKSWDDEHLTELKRNSSDSPSKGSKVILVIAGDFFDEPMFAESSDDCGYLTCRLRLKKLSDSAVTETADIEFSTNYRDKDVEIVTVKEIEAAIGTLIGLDGTGNLLQITNAVGGIINRGEELDISPIGIAEYGCEFRQAIDGLFERRKFQRLAAVAVYHLAVVFEKRDIVGCRLDTKDNAVFVIHLESGLAHMVLDACSLDAGVKIIAEFIFKPIGEFTAQKHGDLFRLDSMNRGADKIFIKRFEISLTFEHHVGGVFNLHETPVISSGKVADSRTICTHYLIQCPVQDRGIKLSRKLLSCKGYFDIDKGIIVKRIADSLSVQLPRKDIMAVAIELQPEGRPCGNTQIAKPIFRMNKIEIVVQTLAWRWFQKGLARVFIVPWFEGIAGFHGREDIYQTRMLSSLLQYLFYAFLFAESLLLDEIDYHAFISRNFFCMRSDILPKLFCPIRILEYKNSLLADKPGHGFSMSNGNQRAGYYDPVIARKRKGNLFAMAFGKRVHGYRLPYQPCYSQLPYAA
jgi:hypothetical protein